MRSAPRCRIYGGEDEASRKGKADMSALEKFIEALQKDPELQSAVEEADSAEELYELASAYGVTLEEIQKLAGQLG